MLPLEVQMRVLLTVLFGLFLRHQIIDALNYHLLYEKEANSL